MSKRKRVLVIGEDSRSFLSSIRSLAKSNYQVYAISLNAQSIALSSRYLHGHLCLSQASTTESVWRTALHEYITTQAIDLVFPCDERAIFPLIELRNKHADFPPCAIVNDDAFYLFLDKWKTKSLAIDCQVDVAKAQHYDNAAQVVLDNVALPVVFKPLQSYREDDIHHRGKVCILRSKQQLQDGLEGQDHPFILEEYFEGTGEGLSVFSVKGEVKVAFAHQRLWESSEGGGSSYRKSVPIDNSQLDAVKKLCQRTEMTGLAMFEFKKNQDTGRWILIEVNARVWGSIPLAIQCGIDFPRYFSDHLVEPSRTRDCHYPNSYPVKQYARNLTSDFNMVRSQFQLKRHKQGTLKGLTFLARRLFEFRRMLIGKETIDSFDRKDVRPFGRECWQIIELLLGFINRKLPIFRAAYRPLVRARLNKHLTHSQNKTIYFLCYGNIVRSPFAEFDLKRLLDEHSDWSIHSVGVHQPTRRSSPEMFIQAATAFDVDLLPHQSKHICEFEITEDDVVFYFDEKNQLFFEQHLSKGLGVNMTDLVGPIWFNKPYIDDPYGKKMQDAQQSYTMINSAVERIYHYMQR
jgi:protein-tyrosine-phosphatase/predicted ATP-grasp superfamily ATP-dependent carboligase